MMRKKRRKQFNCGFEQCNSDLDSVIAVQLCAFYDETYAVIACSMHECDSCYDDEQIMNYYMYVYVMTLFNYSIVVLYVRILCVCVVIN